MCGVLYAQDITYRTVKDLSYSSSKDPYATERCKLDVYYPENKTGCPVVVWFHGGGLTQGNKSIPGRLKKWNGGYCRKLSPTSEGGYFRMSG